jgi:hypothetical protein
MFVRLRRGRSGKGKMGPKVGGRLAVIINPIFLVITVPQ